MLSLPDFKEKQILFVNGADVKGDSLRFKNDNICFLKCERIVNQISCHKIFMIFVIGDCSISTVLIRNCKKYGLSLFLLGKNLAPYAKIISGADGNYLLREKQYKQSDELEIAKKIIANKVGNQRILLGKSDEANKLEKLEIKISNVKYADELLGIEGTASKIFFKAYFNELGWIRRAPRSKIDINNLLLDIGYTMLFNYTEALLNIYGFDIYKGIYHKLFFQRKSLVCDIMEPFRCLIDKQLLKSHNLKQIDKNDFKLTKGCYNLNIDAQNKYAEIFTQCILNAKEHMYKYVRDFYFFTMNNSAFPYFKI